MTSTLSFRTACLDDLNCLVRLLADDELGKSREQVSDPLPPGYPLAFQAIEQDPHNSLLVAVQSETTGSDQHGEVIAGLLQLTRIPSLTYQGSWRAQIEGVRVAASHRSQGIGKRLVQYAIEQARSQGCSLVQLTTDKVRPEALRFYEQLGFRASHEGLKLKLESK